jgi:hypothetical protein
MKAMKNEVMYLQDKECQKLLKCGERHGTDSPSDLKKETTLWHLNFRLLASRTMREEISDALSHTV